MDAPFPPVPPSPQDGETQERIEAEIAETREDLSRTIDEIEHRLNPRRLANQAAESIKDATIGRVEAMMDSASETAADLAGRTRDTAASVAGHVRENPLPAALLGLGLGWLLYSREFSTRETSAPWSDEESLVRAGDAQPVVVVRDWRASGSGADHGCRPRLAHTQRVDGTVASRRRLLPGPRGDADEGEADVVGGVGPGERQGHRGQCS